MMRRKFCEAASKAAAVHLRAIEPLCQFLTRCVRSRTHEWLLSIRFVVPRQRRSFAVRPRRLIVNSSDSPSRIDAAALGQSCSSHVADCSSLACPPRPTA